MDTNTTNTTDTAVTSVTNGDSPDQTVVGPASQSSRRRRILLPFAALATVFMVGFGGTTQAGAMDIGPSNPSAGGLYGSSVMCSAHWNQVRVTTSVAVQTGYTNGQYVRVRYYVNDGRTASWSGWIQRFVHFDSYRPTAIVDHTMNVADGGWYSVYAEIEYWNGYTWGSRRGQWAQKGQAGSYYVDWRNGWCYT